MNVLIIILAILFFTGVYHLYQYFHFEDQILNGSIYNGRRVLFGTITFDGYFCKRLYEEVIVPGYHKEIFNGYESVNILYDETVRHKLYERVKIPDNILINGVKVFISDNTQLIYIGRKNEIEGKKYIIGCIDNNSDYYVYGMIDQKHNIINAEYIGNKEELTKRLSTIYFPKWWGFSMCLSGFILLYHIVFNVFKLYQTLGDY